MVRCSLNKFASLNLCRHCGEHMETTITHRLRASGFHSFLISPKSDLAEAAKYKVNATPTIMINGLKLSGRSIESYKARIDGLLKSAAGN